jgi:hypothetical protein
VPALRASLQFVCCRHRDVSSSSKCPVSNRTLPSIRTLKNSFSDFVVSGDYSGMVYVMSCANVISQHRLSVTVIITG